jgi:hypothetical protein
MLAAARSCPVAQPCVIAHTVWKWGRWKPSLRALRVLLALRRLVLRLYWRPLMPYRPRRRCNRWPGRLVYLERARVWVEGVVWPLGSRAGDASASNKAMVRSALDISSFLGDFRQLGLVRRLGLAALTRCLRQPNAENNR